jgi:peptidoglycan hydrolase CwlO-like protein
MKARFIMYLEVFRFLYDFLSLNLSIRKTYFETFINKTRQFNNFFDEINSKKKDLHLASNNINYKMTMIQDKINRINKSVQDKKMTITNRKAEIDDLEL